MANCCITANELRAILREELKPIKDAIGIDEFPAKLPENIAKESNTQVEITSLASFLEWHIKQVDAVIGSFPSKIKIEDSDLIKTGDQELLLEFPNLAELVSEMMGIVLVLKSYLEVVIHAQSKELLEIGLTKQTGVVNNAILESLQEYFAFKTKAKKEEVQMLFNPNMDDGEESIDKFLQPTKIDVVIEEFDDDNNNFQNTVNIIKEIRAITKGALTRNWKQSSIKDLFKSMLDSLEDVNDDGTGKTDFDIFLERVENGFNDIPTKSDVTDFWGVGYGNRPRIKNLNQP
jgi:hypothetical protein